MGAGASTAASKSRYESPGKMPAMYRTAKTMVHVRRFSANLSRRVSIRRMAADTTVSLSIDRCPSSFRLQPHHVDWTEKFHGSAGALQMALESRTAKLPHDNTGVYIRSTRLSDLEGENVFFHIRQSKPTSPAGSKLMRAPRISSARIRSPVQPHAGGDTADGALLYGRPLSQVMSTGELPEVLQRLQAFLRRDDCIRVEGLFRIPAKAHILKLAQFEIDRGDTPACLQRREEAEVDLNDVHVVAGLYKLFFRKMPQPLIPWDSYDAIMSTKEPQEIVHAFQAKVPTWPLERRKCMENLLCFLATVARHAECNKMSRDNLATVFAPSVLRQQNASPMDDLNSIKDRVMRVKCLLRNYKSIFQSKSAIDTKVSVEL